VRATRIGEPDAPSARRGRAVVIGSGMAGLLAARALADRCGRVTLLERDPAPPPGRPRRGIPQGHHVHLLLKAGHDVLARLFPGILAELEAEGATALDFGADVRWFHFGVWRRRYRSGIVTHSQTRPLLESLVRQRLSRCDGVDVRYETVAAGLTFDAARTRVTGVVVRPAGADGATETLAADLVVDGSGRGSQLPKWLAEAGYPAPAEEQIGIGLSYSSRFFRRTADPRRDWKLLAIAQTPPAGTRGGGAFPVEGDRWLVTLVGYAGDRTPDDGEGFPGFAASLPRPDLHDLIRSAEPVSDVHVYRFPTARWRHFERLDRFPAGLVPVGDAVCSFDPVFGQGMTVAAKEADVLADHLRRDAALAYTRPLNRAIARVVAAPWLMVSVEDLRYPAVVGRRTPLVAAMQRYDQALFGLTGTSTAVYARFLRALHLVDGPGALFHPAVLARVVASLPARLLTRGVDRRAR
jgi:2-polyprenyl-6-methoxyphenol hydroxylase-like FAD-dependent oxidoreductase